MSVEQHQEAAHFVVIHAWDRGEQVYGQAYVYSNYAGGAHRQLTNAIKAWQAGGPPVHLIIYRPAPYMAFTAWAEVITASEEPGQQKNETFYTLTLNQHEFPIPLHLKTNGANLIKQISWLNKGLAVAFNGRSIIPITANDFHAIVNAGHMLEGTMPSITDSAYQALSQLGGGPHTTETILQQAKKNPQFEQTTSAASLNAALSSDQRFTKLGNQWLLKKPIDSAAEPLDEHSLDPESDETDETDLNLTTETAFYRIHFAPAFWNEAREHSTIGVDFTDKPHGIGMKKYRQIKVGDRIVAYLKAGTFGGFGVVTQAYDAAEPLAGTSPRLFGGTLPQRLRVTWAALPEQPVNIAKELTEQYTILYKKIINTPTISSLQRDEYVTLLRLTDGIDVDLQPSELRLPTLWKTLADYRDFISEFRLGIPYAITDLADMANQYRPKITSSNNETFIESLRQFRLLSTSGDNMYQRAAHTEGDSEALMRLMVVALLVESGDDYILPARAIFKRHVAGPMPQPASSFAPELGEEGETLLKWYSQAGLIDLGSNEWRWTDDAFEAPTGSDPASRVYATFLNTLLAESSDSLATDLEPVKGPLPIAPNYNDGLRTLSQEMLIDESIVQRIYRSLLAGRNIVLSGPPGTGKTELAKRLPSLFWQEQPKQFTRLTTQLEQSPIETIEIQRHGYHAILVTATEDWSVRDIVGGIAPRLNSEQSSVAYDMNYGHLTQAVLRHYVSTEQGRRPPTNNVYNRRDFVEKDKRYRGVWLIIDEFTRAPVDAAFGGLLTTLGGGDNADLQVSTGDFSTINIPLPADFRIIGTLNSFDRHFLNQMSEAIKRRFDFIDVMPPSAKHAAEERGIAVYKALDKLRNQGFTAITSTTQPAGRIAYHYNDVHVTPITNAAGLPRYELHASGDAALTLNSFWRLFEVIRIFRQLGTAQAIAIYTNIFAGVLVGMSWEAALDAALADSLVDQLQVMTRDEQRIVQAYVELTDESAKFAEAVNEIIKTLPTNRRPELYGLFREVDQHRNDGANAITTALNASQAEGLFKTGTPLTLPANSVFKRRLRSLITERGL